jgi:hypothetical protein
MSGPQVKMNVFAFFASCITGAGGSLGNKPPIVPAKPMPSK